MAYIDVLPLQPNALCPSSPLLAILFVIRASSSNVSRRGFVCHRQIICAASRREELQLQRELKNAPGTGNFVIFCLIVRRR